MTRELILNGLRNRLLVQKMMHFIDILKDSKWLLQNLVLFGLIYVEFECLAFQFQNNFLSELLFLLLDLSVSHLLRFLSLVLPNSPPPHLIY